MKIDLRTNIFQPENILVYTGHFHETPAYRTVRPRGHTAWLVLLTLSGQGRFGYPGGELLADPGKITLVEPGVFNDYGTAFGASHFELVWAHFQPRLHWPELLVWPRYSEGLMQLDIAGSAYEEQITEAMWKIHRIATSGRPRRAQFAMAALEEMLLWCTVVNPLGGQAAVDRRVAEAIEYICGNLADDLSAQKIADRVFVSSSRLAHLFSRDCGVSMQQYVEERRLERAKQLLAATSRSIQAISADVGYESPFYFSQRFKKSTGESPTEYRMRTIAEY